MISRDERGNVCTIVTVNETEVINLQLRDRRGNRLLFSRRSLLPDFPMASTHFLAGYIPRLNTHKQSPSSMD